MLQENRDDQTAARTTGKRAANADEGNQYQTYTSNKDANIQFEKGFFPYDPGEAYTGYYWQGKIFCFVLMFLAEIGDKTFIITMIAYHELGACITFITAYVTLCAMHILAATLGWGISYVIPPFWTKLICTVIFLLLAIGMFIMACYERNNDDVNVALGKKGHSVTLTKRERVEVNQAQDNQAEGGSSDEESGDEDDDSDDSEGDSEDDSEESGDKESGSDEGSDESDLSEEKVTAQHPDKVDEGDANQVVFRSQSVRVTPKFQALSSAQKLQTDKDGIYNHHRDQYKGYQLSGKKLQRFCCCGSWCTTSLYVLFPLMLIANEMLDKTQITAIAMAPSYGFQSIVIAGIFAQFFSVALACFCSAALGECIKSRFWLNLFCALMFLIFGLYELIGELIMENSDTWAERKV